MIFMMILAFSLLSPAVRQVPVRTQSASQVATEKGGTRTPLHAGEAAHRRGALQRAEGVRSRKSSLYSALLSAVPLHQALPLGRESQSRYGWRRGCK